MKAIILRHNGIGDLVMAFPIIGTLLNNDFDVTLESARGNHEMMQWFFPQLKCRECTQNPYSDFRINEEGFHYFLNFNKLETLDDAAVHLGQPTPNWQLSCLSVYLLQGLPHIYSLSPSDYVNKNSDNRLENIFVFPTSTSASRNISEKNVEIVLNTFPNAIVNPKFGSREDLAKAIGKAKLVISGDSGAIHLAEATSTPWVCFNTSFSAESRYLFYRYGYCIESTSNQSPCGKHVNHCGCNPFCKDTFDDKEVREVLQLAKRKIDG